MSDWIRTLFLLLIVLITRKLQSKFYQGIRAKITKRIKWKNFVLGYLAISIILLLVYLKIISIFHVNELVSYVILGVILGSFFWSVLDLSTKESAS